MDHCDYNTLECRLKAAKKRISELESGEKYRELQTLISYHRVCSIP